MKASIAELAIFSGTPAFNQPLHVGQLNLPPFAEFEATFKGIFERRYFTNHGPLVQELDAKLAARLGVRHAVSVSNATIALMVACKALNLKGEVIVPAFTFAASVQILTWAGLTPVFCDVDPETQMITAVRAEKLITPKTSAVLAVHLWGRACDPKNLADLCRQRNLKLIFDSAHAIGCTFEGRNIGGFGDVEVFSFHATKVLGATEGGALTTNDDDLAGQIRTVRNFHSSQTYGEVPVRINGKMTEAQAGFALLGLAHLDEWIERNRKLYQRHQERAGATPGVRFVDHAYGERSNYQYCVVAVDPQLGVTRDEMRQILEAENIWARRYFYPGMHRTAPYGAPGGKSNVNLPVTDMLCTQLLQLPLGSGMTNDDVDRIWDIVELCTRHPEEIRKRLDSRSQ